ncbi:MAG: FAD-dependent monooxygenase [Xenococcaceae cyanobacterium]
MTQVIIVGAGPAGATLALIFAQRGIRVKLIEASRNFRRVFRGEGLMPSGLDAIEQMGLSDLLESIPHRPLTAWEFLIDNRSLFRVEEPIEPGGKPCTLVSQPAFLDALIDKANAYTNFEFVPGTPIQDLLVRDRRVSGVKLADDREEAADLVIGVDGRNSIVRQRANLSLQQTHQSFDILWFKLPDSQHLAAENIFYSIVNRDRAFGLFRSSEGHLQIGWALHSDLVKNWKQIDWTELLASASPAWLASHVRQNVEAIEKPVLLSVVVGCCDRWHVPGLLLLGDAVHPMSPIRAQGINMALRDTIVAANYLVPLLRQDAESETIDRILPQIQADRQPEILRVQQLQSQESAQGELLIKNPLLRWGASHFAPIIRDRVRQSWLDRQRQLRKGVATVKLEV